MSTKKEMPLKTTLYKQGGATLRDQSFERDKEQVRPIKGTVRSKELHHLQQTKRKNSHLAAGYHEKTQGDQSVVSHVLQVRSWAETRNSLAKKDCS